MTLSLRKIRNLGLIALVGIILLMGMNSLIIGRGTIKDLTEVLEKERPILRRASHLSTHIGAAQNYFLNFIAGRETDTLAIVVYLDTALEEARELEKLMTGPDREVVRRLIVSAATFRNTVTKIRGLPPEAIAPEVQEEALVQAQRVLSATKDLTEKTTKRIEYLDKRLIAENLRAQRMNAFFILLALVSAFLVAFFMNRALAKPIRMLVEETEKIARGDLTHRIKVKTRDEIGELAQVFNEITKNLRESKGEIEKYSERLEKRVEEKTKELEESNKALQSITKVLSSAVSEVPLKKILEDSIVTAMELIGADAGSIGILDRKKNIIRYPVNYKMPDFLNQVTAPAGKGIAGYVMTKKKPMIIDDYPSMPQALKEFIRGGLKTLIAVPLMYRGEALGTLGVFGLSLKRRFTEEELEKILAIADNLSLAISHTAAHIEKEKTEDDLRKYAKDLEASTKELMDSRRATLNILEDVTEAKGEIEKAYQELKETQEQLIQAGKMASTGRLAAGIAHEMNNPLVGVLNFAQLLLKKIKKGDPNLEYVKMIERGALQCQRIVRGLLTFARQDREPFRPTDVNKSIQEALLLAETQIKLQKIKVEYNFTSNLPKIMGSANQLQQMALNMIINARDAMPQGGSLTIITRLRSPGLKRELIEVIFQDTGAGMTREEIARVFDPFFTTKKPGRGTGLGLAISYGIIKNHGGDIRVDSERGRGTTFTIMFPVAKAKFGGGGGGEYEKAKTLVVDDKTYSIVFRKGKANN